MTSWSLVSPSPSLSRLATCDSHTRSSAVNSATVLRIWLRRLFFAPLSAATTALAASTCSSRDTRRAAAALPTSLAPAAMTSVCSEFVSSGTKRQRARSASCSSSASTNAQSSPRSKITTAVRIRSRHCAEVCTVTCVRNRSICPGANTTCSWPPATIGRKTAPLSCACSANGANSVATPSSTENDRSKRRKRAISALLALQNYGRIGTCTSNRFYCREVQRRCRGGQCTL